jgi:hypothetical protein
MFDRRRVAVGADGASPDTGHPAPARGRASLAALWFGLFGAPAAWSVQTLVNVPLAAHGCFPRLRPVASPVTGGLRGLAFAVSLATLAACVAAVLVAWRSWRGTRAEHQASSGRGERHDASTALLETGEGRTRFMALAGVLTSVTFLIVSLAHAAAIFLVLPCGASG